MQTINFELHKSTEKHFWAAGSAIATPFGNDQTTGSLCWVDVEHINIPMSCSGTEDERKTEDSIIRSLIKPLFEEDFVRQGQPTLPPTGHLFQN